MILYGLKTCDTCRKALKSLPSVRFVDVRTDGVPTDVLARAHAQFGAALVNTRSTTWREMDQTARDLPALDQLAQFPSLMKRPLIVTSDAIYLGWDKATQTALGI